MLLRQTGPLVNARTRLIMNWLASCDQVNGHGDTVPAWGVAESLWRLAPCTWHGFVSILRACHTQQDRNYMMQTTYTVLQLHIFSMRLESIIAKHPCHWEALYEHIVAKPASPVCCVCTPRLPHFLLWGVHSYSSMSLSKYGHQWWIIWTH